MPYIRRLPSGKWQATVRGPDGKKHTFTDPLQKVVKAWALDEESKIAQGRWRDPRRAKVPLGEWCEKWMAGRVVSAETRRANEATLRNHILPHWADWRLYAIDALAVQTWVRQMQQNGVGPHAIKRAYALFATMLSDAVSAGVLPESPCRKPSGRRAVDLPATPRKLPAWFTRDQVDRIRAQLEVRRYGDKLIPLGPSERGHSVMTELMVTVGLRWGEAAGIVGAVDDTTGVGNPVDWLRGRISVIGTLSQHGKWKELPKNSASRAEVPVPRDILDAMAPLLEGRERTDFVFVTRRGARPLNGANWRQVWYEAIDRANEQIRRENRKLPADKKVPLVPRLDPHDCRHTAASWLVQEGVDLFRVQHLLRHESYATTQRYAHLAPDKHAPIEDVWASRPSTRSADGSAS